MAIYSTRFPPTSNRDTGDEMPIFDFRLVDVFSETPLSGNGLAVFFMKEDAPGTLLQRMTGEMRQFESIFLWETVDLSEVRARVFTMEEELGFAGHPVLGAAGAVHAERFPDREQVELTFQLPEKTVPVVSRKRNGHFFAEMNQGRAEFGPVVADERVEEVLAAVNLSPADLAANLPIQMVSTGLPYLVVPIRAGLDRARIVRRDFEAFLATFGAKFVFVLDVETLEGRTWDNDGRVEDIATGSAAGPAGAFLVAHGRAVPDVPLTIRQGRFLGRPSELRVTVIGTTASSVLVGGGVVPVGRGILEFSLDA